ncbi:hypothetical protein SMAC4_07131 [Sordaria macrospora]|uniref:WGS project CABT00000000 data, contig 2.39 n=1 Tax=Sordaria macrospora (strain ATCC MYA-333 / DSM 997 / K(L3346) / K-hell) TaxID=771870 RepID=F7W7F6_SORMK|nr:uncharacterized protein SMAC_07131 [Sordaria macrospora k-hell]KAH7630263.1 hypothetical protein B0T09DRAFT_374454 [Sordaria sp. MPI-SDFR-AT-0083]WPJ66932.1 hypothetical protein SMAC4_07131 [Sordaria macrospora]CCC13507.1 unnamed protein product [Sordaria macrospora k-hell]
MSYAGNSNVGFPSIYEDGNQRHISQSQVDDLAQHSGKNVKGYRPQDQNAAVNEHYMEESAKEREEAVKRDPTLAAEWHGNKPHRGARIDKELAEEDAAELKKKDQKQKHNITGATHF